MKNKLHFVLALLLICMMPMLCFAEEETETEEIFTSGEWEYFLNDDGTATISSWEGYLEEEVTVPDKLDGFQVTEIRENTFLACSNLTSVEIPQSITEIGVNAFLYCTSLENIYISPDNENYAAIDNVIFEKNSKTLVFYSCGLKNTKYTIPKGITKIGESAFSCCDNLVNIEISDSVTVIERQAFYNCSNLTSIEIPETVTEIGKNAFYYCTSLTDIRVSLNNEAYIVIDNVLFEKNSEILVYYPCGLTNSTYIIPEGISAIEMGAFAYSTSLTSITIPKTVTEIGVGAFAYCSNLASIEIPGSVTEIEENAFLGCDSLTLIVEKDSYAAQYAKDNEIPYSYPDANDWLND